ncbi:MAG TPA: hypothetical protein VG871_18600 [Vicinamibacterales bacterium]|nr:hypothetical protein [Vicinamibacterales bacterium]
MSGIAEVVVEAAALFAACLAVHVVIWRVRRPGTYRVWLPLLAGIFLVAGPAAEWTLTRTAATPDLLAVLLMHGALSSVYIIGYTLISAFSPSIEILKLLERSPAGLRREEIQLPYLQTALGGNRVVNLVNDGLIEAAGSRVSLGAGGRVLAGLVLFYRHTIGLPDGAGG